MSTFFGTADPGGDVREVALIHKILERTRQGKLKWQRQQNIISATTANGLQFYFVLNVPFASLGQSWVTFTVKDQNAEIAKVQNNVYPFAIPTIVVAQADAVHAAEELFQAVSGVADNNLERVIKKLDNI
jgi:hypothetical protein